MEDKGSKYLLPIKGYRHIAQLQQILEEVVCGGGGFVWKERYWNSRKQREDPKNEWGFGHGKEWISDDEHLPEEMADSKAHANCGLECPMVLRDVMALKEKMLDQDKEGDPNTIEPKDADVGAV